MNRKRELLVACKVDRGDDIVGAGATSDERRPSIDQAVEGPAGLVVGTIAGMDERAVEAGQLEAGGRLRHGVLLGTPLAPGILGEGSARDSHGNRTGINASGP